MIYGMTQPVSAGPLKQLCVVHQTEQRKRDMMNENHLVLVGIKCLHFQTMRDVINKVKSHG